jgi:hypothetical protein
VVNNLTFYSKNYNSFDTTVVKDGKSHSVRDWLTNGHRKDAEWNIYHQSGSIASET